MRLKFHKKKNTVENKHFWLKLKIKFILKSYIFLLDITGFNSRFIMCICTTHIIAIIVIVV